jgi:hypothetical protein
MGHDVFLSHSHADKVFADAICHKLEACDIRCWVAPRDIRPSEDWAEAIINAMDSCKILVLVFSSRSNTSPQVRREVERAVNKGLGVLPFRIEDVPLSKSLEYFISTQHWLDAITGDMEEHLATLCSSVAMLLGRLAPAASSIPPRAVAAPIVAPAAAPVAAPAPPAAAVSPELLERMSAQLARTLGPIAMHLVKRAAATGMAPKDMVAALSREIEDENERKQFVARCRDAIR